MGGLAGLGSVTGGAAGRSSRVKQNVDVTQITPRVVAMGFPWKRRTQVDAHRNNVGEVAEYLRRRYGEHYMVFNLSDKHDVQYHHFDYQALEFDTDA